MAELVPDTSAPPHIETETHTSRVPLEFSLKYLKAFVELWENVEEGGFGRLNDSDEPYPVSALGVLVDDRESQQVALPCDIECYGCRLDERESPPFFTVEACQLHSDVDSSFIWNGSINFEYRPEYHCWQDEDYLSGDRSVLLFPKKAVSWDSLWDTAGMLYHPAIETV